MAPMSVDLDIRGLRHTKGPAGAAPEVREWIEQTLGEKLATGDLAAALKDGTVLCRLINHVSPDRPVRFKKSGLPFVQMENISNFLTACEQAPFNLPGHDRFLTVDLFEAKDISQVIQCLGAFSRVANAIRPDRVPTTIGPQSELVRSATVAANDGRPTPGSMVRNRLQVGHGQISPSVTGGSVSSRTTDSGRPMSSLGDRGSVRSGSDTPAWNYIQYGSTLGANQASQGMLYGGRRQIVDPTTAASTTPTSRSVRNKPTAANDGSMSRRQAQLDHLEREEQRIQDEIDRRRAELEQQRQAQLEQLRQQRIEWERQEQEWNAREQARLHEEREAERRIRDEQEKRRVDLTDDPAGKSALANSPDRVAKQLEEAKERERLYMLERETRRDFGSVRSRSSSRLDWRPASSRDSSPKASEVSWAAGEEMLSLRSGRAAVGGLTVASVAEDPGEDTRSRQSAVERPSPATPARPLPDPSVASLSTRPAVRPSPSGLMSSPATLRPKSSGSSSSTPRAAPSTRPLPVPTVHIGSPTITADASAVTSPRPLPKPMIRKSSATVRTDIVSQAPRLLPTPAEPEVRVMPKLVESVASVARPADAMPRISPRPADSMPRMAPKPADSMPRMAPKPAESMPRLTPKPAESISKLSPKPAESIAQVVPKPSDATPPGPLVRPSGSVLGGRPLPRPTAGSLRRSPFGRMSPDRAGNIAGGLAEQQQPQQNQQQHRIPSVHLSREMALSSAAEQENDAGRRLAAQQKIQAASLASKSLLDREMERERDRLNEWEAEQQRKAGPSTPTPSRSNEPSGAARGQLPPTSVGTSGQGGMAAVRPGGQSPERASPSRASPSRSEGLSVFMGGRSPSRIGERGPSPFARALVGPRPKP